MSGQTKAHSWLEAWTNVAIGFGINYVTNLTVLPLFGMHPSFADAFWIGVIMTFVSVGRSYVLRRIYNRITVQRGEGSNGPAALGCTGSPG